MRDSSKLSVLCHPPIIRTSLRQIIFKKLKSKVPGVSVVPGHLLVFTSDFNKPFVTITYIVYVLFYVSKFPR